MTVVGDVGGHRLARPPPTPIDHDVTVSLPWCKRCVWVWGLVAVVVLVWVAEVLVLSFGLVLVLDLALGALSFLWVWAKSGQLLRGCALSFPGVRACRR